MANKYEMIVVLSPVLGEEGFASTTESIKTKLETGATIEVQETLGMKRMAYEINDQKEGFYLQFNFSSEPEFPKELDRVLKITEGVLRHLIIRTDE
ncbi:MAG: 30S ribosomal protein S6 [Oscillospiraceae bacterium]|jgi:small subunit ribosomal protein S6|nr:30S ribosomal protein S6 [Clostridiales bacterium]MDD4094709.1 30S ribosomal protein S6 [Oscillospiraceae bacterium]